MIYGRNFFDHPLKNDTKNYCYWSRRLLDYPYFKESYKLIGINLSKQQALDAAPKANHQINFTGNPKQARNTTIFFITEKVKETILDFLQGTVRVL